MSDSSFNAKARAARRTVEDEEEPACFGRCNKTKACGGCFPCFRFNKRFDCIVFSIFVTMLVGLCLAVVTPILVNKLVDNEIYREVVIDSPEAESYESWQTNTKHPGDDTKVYYDIYLFDYQNVDELLAGAKPVVIERGPYHFREYFNKFDITWADDGNEVTFNSQKYYIFEKDGTGAGLSLDDYITIPYVTVIGFEWLLAALPPEVNIAVEMALHEKVFGPIEANLTAIMDDHLPISPIYKQAERILNLVTTLEADIDRFIASAPPGNGLLKMIMCLTPLGEQQVDGITPFWKSNPVPAYFGWLNDPILNFVLMLLIESGQDEETIAGWSTAVPGVATNWTSIEDTRRRRAPDTVKTGKKYSKEVNQYIRYENQSSQWVCILPMESKQAPEYVEGQMFPACAHFQNDWSDEQCEAHGYGRAFNTDYANRIQGTDASLYGYPVTDEKLATYVSDIYRSAFLINTEIVTDWYDVPLRRYELQRKDLLNATMWPPAWQWSNNAPSGMENMTFFGVPSFVSKPHFLEGDDSLVAAVVGLNPKVEIHQTRLDIEPNTGLTARAWKRLQANYYMSDNYLPVVEESSIDIAAWACGNFTALTGDNHTCEVWDYLFACLAQESDWQYAAGGVYAPYAWVEESVVYNSDTADGIKLIHFIRDMGYTFQLWCFVGSGLLFAMLVGLLYAKKKHDENEAEEEIPLLMPQGDGHGSNPLTDKLVYDSEPSHYDSRGSATQGVAMRATSRDNY